MSERKKAIISSGLGQYAANDPNAQAHFGPDAQAKVKELLATSIRKANEAGFDVIAVDANPKDAEDTLKRFSETLRERQDVVGVNIGYGLRGHKGIGCLSLRRLLVMGVSFTDPMFCFDRAYRAVREDDQYRVCHSTWDQDHVLQRTSRGYHYDTTELSRRILKFSAAIGILGRSRKWAWSMHMWPLRSIFSFQMAAVSRILYPHF